MRNVKNRHGPMFCACLTTERQAQMFRKITMFTFAKNNNNRQHCYTVPVKLQVEMQRVAAPVNMHIKH